MTIRRVLTLMAATALVGPLIVVGAGQAAAQGRFTATPLVASSRVVTDKAPTSRLARSDAGLLARTDAARTSVLVKLDYDALATYAGGIRPLAATSPSVTGVPLTGRPAEQSYTRFIVGKETAFLNALARAVPGATVGRRLRTVYGGVSITVPANATKTVAAIPGVVAVQQNRMRTLLSDASADFLGAPVVYNALGETVPDAGKGTILGNLDSGVWPEHPSLADQGNLPAPPGPARQCVFGDNPLTPADDPFVCQHKLIGGAPFTQTYDAQVGDDPYAGTARDGDGHGTHTATTSAGDVVSNVSIFGRPFPAIHGIAPGAYVMEYKVCGPQGCFGDDSMAAVGQAILDGVNVINFSISGGTDPYTDPVELAFLDAYAAGVFVSASAGNDGPTAGTANHLSPWVTSVAASTLDRQFATTLTLEADNGDVFTAQGASLTPGVPSPQPVVLASAAPYNDALCTTPAPAGTFTGKIVACQRGGNARIEKGYDVKQGGAAGMILYNPTLADIETDNHWLPAVHLADGTQFLAFLSKHTAVSGSFPAGTAQPGRGDVMAAFSSRGPGGPTIKPDLTAPGIQILAGDTPTPPAVDGGPPGQYFQAIAGTSMSSPHVAGSALLLKALHRSWTPGQIRSALMTTATTAVVKEDLTTKADPFDLGAGRVDLHVAGSATLTFDETAQDMTLLGTDPISAINLNIPSVDAPVLPGQVTAYRTAVNVSDHPVSFSAQTTAPPGSVFTVTPSTFTVAPGRSVRLRIILRSVNTPSTQDFGEVRLVPAGASDGPALHLPVAFVPQQGTVSLTTGCNPASIVVAASTRCTVTAQNQSSTDTSADLTTAPDPNLQITGATDATLLPDGTVTKKGVPLKGSQLGIPAVAPGPTPAGYLPLASFGIAPQTIGDEEFLNMNVPPFVYAGATYTTIGVSSNGFVKAGGGTSADNNCCNLPAGPDPAPPNTMVAPYWTDLDGVGAPGVYAGTLTDGAHSWIVVEQRENIFGTTSQQVFETWIGINGTEDITFDYDPAHLPADPGQDFLVGAENAAGQGDIRAVLPTQDLRVTSTAPTPGDSVTYSVTVRGLKIGNGKVNSRLQTPLTPGTTIANTTVVIRRS